MIWPGSQGNDTDLNLLIYTYLIIIQFLHTNGMADRDNSTCTLLPVGQPTSNALNLKQA